MTCYYQCKLYFLKKHSKLSKPAFIPNVCDLFKIFPVFCNDVRFLEPCPQGTFPIETQQGDLCVQSPEGLQRVPKAISPSRQHTSTRNEVQPVQL